LKSRPVGFHALARMVSPIFAERMAKLKLATQRNRGSQPSWVNVPNIDA